MVTAVTQNVGNCSGPGFQRAAYRCPHSLNVIMSALKVCFMLQFGLPQLRLEKVFVRYWKNFSLAKQRKVFNSFQHLCLSLLRQPDRLLHLRVKAVHQPIGALQTNRTNQNSCTLKQLAPIWSPQSLRMSAIVLDLDSKGRLSAFGCVSFVTFLWQHKEKFIFNTHLGFK